MRIARYPGIQCLSGHIGPRFLPGDRAEARHPSHVHRVRRRCVEREGLEGGSGDPGALPDRPVAGDLRAVIRQGKGRQRDRRLHLPVERWLVEVRPGKQARHPRYQRLVAERRIPRGLHRGREQHERGVVGHHGQGQAGHRRTVRRLPARRILRPEAGLHARSIRPGHGSGGDQGPLRSHRSHHNDAGSENRQGEPAGRSIEPRAAIEPSARARDIQHGRQKHKHTAVRDALRVIPLLPRLRPYAVLLRGSRGEPERERHGEPLDQRARKRTGQPDRRDLLREPGPEAANPICELGEYDRCAGNGGYRAGEGLSREYHLGRQVVPAGRILPHRAPPLAVRGRPLRPLQGRLLR